MNTRLFRNFSFFSATLSFFLLGKAFEARIMLKDTHERNNKIDNEIIKSLALFSPEARDFRVFKSMRKIEQISDRSVNIVKLAYFAQKGGKLKL